MDEHLLRFNPKEEYVFIDCETFNLCLSEFHNVAWQVSMIKVRNDKKIDQRDFFIDWGTELKISKEAKFITKYNEKEVKSKSVPPEKALPDIKKWLNECDHIVGHNILGFDIYIIKWMFEYMNAPYQHLTPKVIDTNCLAKGLKMQMPYDNKSDFLAYQYKMYHTRRKGVRTRLEYLAKEMEIKHDETKLHDAIVDLELNFKVWKKLKWQIEV